MAGINNDYYEHLIDQMMIDDIVDEDTKSWINEAGGHERRLLMLSVIDSDRAAFLSILNKFLNKDSPAALSREIVAQLREYVKVASTEVKAFGEVMTPFSLVEEMLDTLPAEVWSNPDLKWLDPANGVGTFPAVIVLRLMKGLKGHFPRAKKRYQHIMENMVHVCELQAKNMFLYLCAFDPNDVNGLNVYHGSFLEEGFDTHAKEVWGVDKFDIVVGNPPYQEDSSNNKKTKPIWHNFVLKSTEWLTDKGYLVMVHPSGWRNVAGRFKEVQLTLRERQMLYLEMHGIKDGIKTFGAGTRYDFYCLKNTPNGEYKTTIIDQDGITEHVDISSLEFVPSGMFEEVFSLLAKLGEKKVEILHSWTAYESRKPHMSKEKTKEFKHPCVQNVNVSGQPSCMYYSNTADKGHFGIPKFMWGPYTPSGLVDTNGTYGMCQHVSAIVDTPKNLEKIARAVRTEQFQQLIKVIDPGGFATSPINRKVIALFRKDFWKEFI